MIGILKKQSGMNIVGQGGKFILFMLPSLIAATWVHINFPRAAALPKSIDFIKPIGYLLLPLGLLLWGTAIMQLAALITWIWVYLVASVFLYAGVMIFIGKEEQQLKNAFGKEYEDYLARIHQLVPFKKP